MSRQLALIHTVRSLVPVFGALTRELAPDVTTTDLVDEALLEEAIAAGEVPRATAERLERHVAAALEAGADAVLVTCSSMGGVVDELRARHGWPLMRVDEAMVDAALTAGPRIGVVATLGSTLQPTAAPRPTAGHRGGTRGDRNPRRNAPGRRRLRRAQGRRRRCPRCGRARGAARAAPPGTTPSSSLRRRWHGSRERSSESRRNADSGEPAVGRGAGRRATRPNRCAEAKRLIRRRPPVTVGGHAATCDQRRSASSSSSITGSTGSVGGGVPETGSVVRRNSTSDSATRSCSSS